MINSPATRTDEQQALTHRLLGAAASARESRWAWWGPLLAMLVGGVPRFVNLGQIHRLIFDETYYVKQGWSLIQFGYERDIKEGLEEPDELFTNGTADVFGSAPDLVVHPPVGKWMIGAGEWLFGIDSSFGWRFAAAVVGTLSILLLGRIAWLMWRNATLATVAATLLAVDGHHFVHSRTGLLDIFLMWWVLVAFYFLLKDREQARERLAVRWGSVADRSFMSWGPHLGMRWWRIAAGVSLGLACGTKWSGAFFLAVFGIMTVLWDMNARRAAGVSSWFKGGVFNDGIPAFFSMVGVAALTYLASWTGWFATEGGWKRDWAQDHPAEGLARIVPDPLRSLFAYHQEVLSFHTGLQNEHAWASNPWTWIVQGRPTLFFSRWPSEGEDGCTVAECTRYITSLGNLFVWWGAAIGIFVVLFLWLFGRDWRAGAALSGVIAGWLPWFLYQTRTIYSFYAIAFTPWLVLIVVTVLALILGGQEASESRRFWGRVIVVSYVLLAVLFFALYYPVYVGQLIPRTQWSLLMFLPSWT